MSGEKMLFVNTINDLKKEIDKLDVEINKLQNDYGVAYSWAKYTIIRLVRIKESYKDSINYLNQQITLGVGNAVAL